MRTHMSLIVCLALLPLLVGQSCCPPFCSSCDSLGEACFEDSDCCSNHCEGGTCCGGPGADLDYDEPVSNCCSGQSREGPLGPYCCATAGTVVPYDDRCCEGLVRHPTTGECTAPCASPCYWELHPLEGEDLCVCPGGDGPGIVCQPCSPCYDSSESDCWVYRVYHAGYYDDFQLGQQCRVFGPFCAPDEATAEACARNGAAVAGFSTDWPLVVEEYSGPLDDSACLFP